MLLLSLITSLFAADHDYIATWRTTPDIVYCKNSKVALSDVKNAIDYWGTKGHDFGDLLIRESCTTKPEFGLIKIGPPDASIENDTYGHTHIKWAYDDTMDFAVVVISKEGSYIYEVVVHEIGHALGLDHSHNVNSIMYAKHVGTYTRM